MTLFSCLLMTALLSTPVNAQNFREVDSSLKNSSAKSKLADPIYKIDDKYKDIENNLVGHYTLSFGQGSKVEQKLITLSKNRKYTIIGSSFTTPIRIGDWRVVDGKYLHLLAYDAYPFNVYGRHTTELNETSRVVFNGIYFSHNTFINYDNVLNETPTLTPILNKNIDRSKRPYISKLPQKYNSISLAYNPNDKNSGDKEIDIYTFNNKNNFNDFAISARINLTYQDTVKATIKEDYLVFEQGKTTKRFVPEITNEDDSSLEDMENLAVSPKTIYQNIAGKPFVEPFVNPKDYTFDNDIKAYVAINKCRTSCPTEEEYGYFDIFYEYQLLEDITVQQSKFKIANTVAVPLALEE